MRDLARMKCLLPLIAMVFFGVQAGASPSLTDFWNGNAKWVKDAEKIGSDFDFHFVSILAQPHELWAYYIHNYTAPDGKFKMTIGRARGQDGLNWTNDGMVLDVSHASAGTNGTPPLWDDRLTSFPGAWKDGDTWYLVYEGAGEHFGSSPGDIGLATSQDGSNFVKHPKNPIFRHKPTGWERANIGTPSLYKENGIWYLFYHGYDFNVCQVGVATGPSLTNLSRSASNPILRVSSALAAWDSGTTGKRSSIFKEGPYYYFAFEGSTAPPFAQSKWSSSLARSTNLISGWTEFPGSPMITQTSGGMGYDGPELLRLNGFWYLYVRTPASTQTERFRLEAKPPLTHE
jgi:hypothetical protein